MVIAHLKATMRKNIRAAIKIAIEEFDDYGSGIPEFDKAEESVELNPDAPPTRSGKHRLLSCCA